MLTPQQIELVTNSWEQVLPIKETAADLFYNKLFELDPALRPLFKDDIKVQGERLMNMIDVAVKALNRLEDVVPAVQAMGRRHKDYGVKESHYDTVAGALLWTLEQGLGEAFTAEVKDAWTQVYTVLATTMITAANEEVETA